ncbi:MAG: hypothetical protein IT370_23885 [Deltaproteobacteria bacterium]|nr:hypothetical protein [Deltaproteobacteria bacterium]
MMERAITILRDRESTNPAYLARLANELTLAGWATSVVDAWGEDVLGGGFLLVEGWPPSIRELFEAGRLTEPSRVVALGIDRFDFSLLEEYGLAGAIDHTQEYAWFVTPEKGGHHYVYGHRYVAAHAKATDGNDKPPFASERYTIMEFGGDSWPKELARYLDELRALEGAGRGPPAG